METPFIQFEEAKKDNLIFTKKNKREGLLFLVLGGCKLTFFHNLIDI